MSELEELFAERERINEKIKTLQNRYLRVGCAKLHRDPACGQRPDIFSLEIEVTLYGTDKKRWRGIGRDSDKSRLIETIPKIINDLSNLYDAARRNEADE